MIKVTKLIVKLKNGAYVKDWQYSQGFLDIVETLSPFQAISVSSADFNMFFTGIDAEHLIARYQVTFSK
jgi:hypothetical protein